MNHRADNEFTKSPSESTLENPSENPPTDRFPEAEVTKGK
jgi:hypothetical protein